MTLIGIGVLDDFKLKHADIRSPLNTWIQTTKEAKWKTPQDVKDRHASASILDDNQIIFNLKGNKYRLLVRVSFESQIVRVKKIGTHAEYSKW
jgi:mRNA interferase HigB